MPCHRQRGYPIQRSSVLGCKGVRPAGTARSGLVRSSFSFLCLWLFLGFEFLRDVVAATSGQGNDGDLLRFSRFTLHRAGFYHPRVFFRVKGFYHSKGQCSGQLLVRRPYRNGLDQDSSSHSAGRIGCFRSARVNAGDVKLGAQWDLAVIVHHFRSHVFVSRTARRSPIREAMQGGTSARLLASQRCVLFCVTIRGVMFALCNHGETSHVHATGYFNVRFTGSRVRCLSFPGRFFSDVDGCFSEYVQIGAILVGSAGHFSAGVTWEVFAGPTSVNQDAVLLHLSLRTVCGFVPRFEKGRRAPLVAFRDLPR